MSENNVNGITGGNVATTTGIVGATVAIGQYIINDYVITIAPVEGDYGYTMTITRGSDTQTVTLYGLSTEQYNSMLGYLQQAQEAAQSATLASQNASVYANTAGSYAGNAAQYRDNAKNYSIAAANDANRANSAKSSAQSSATSANNAKTAAEAAATRAETAATSAGNARTAAEAAQTAAEAAQTAAETAETNAQTYAGQASQSATNAGQSATSAAQTLTQVQNEGATQITAIDTEGQRVLDSIPEDYTALSEDVADLKSQIEVLEPAAASADVGKALIVKTVADGKVTEYEFGEAGGSADIDSIITVEQNLTGADSSNHKMLMQKDSAFETELTARDYRKIGYVNVMRGAADITKWVYADGEIGVDCAFDDLRVEVIAPNKVPAKTVDICLFTGQSNMSGRGDASQATVCPAGEGYWWHNNQFEQIVDPVGNESVSTGTMIPAICKAYYDTTNVPIVAVVNAIGGTTISYWQPDTGAYNNSVSWVNAAKAYAEQNGYTVRHVMMCWCQGENDVADGTTKTAYKAAFITMCDGLAEDAEIELFFNIKIGQHKTDASYDFTAIREAQDELCQENPNYINVSDKFRGAPMKDAWHFAQPELNLTGQNAGINMGYYMLTGIKPLYPSYNYGDAFDQNVASDNAYDLTGWSYQLFDRGIGLTLYTGTEKTVSIPDSAIFDGFSAPIFINTVANAYHGFRGNTTIEEVYISQDVKYAQNGSSNVQNIARLFEGCTALKKVTSLPAIGLDSEARYRSADYLYAGCSALKELVFPENATSMVQCCNGCALLTQIPDFPDSCTSLQAAFGNSQISHLPDIPDSCTNILSIFLNNSSLTSIGRIGAGVTNMASAFRYCPNLAGVVRIESPDVSNMTSAFHSSAIPNITFQVPANSTTYTTLTTQYPTANVETF